MHSLGCFRDKNKLLKDLLSDEWVAGETGGKARGRNDRSAADERPKPGEGKHMGWELKTAVTNGKIKAATGWGCVGVLQKVCGVENLGFSPLMKSREAVALDVTDYRSLNPDLTALPNRSRPAANTSLWVTLFLFCSSSNLCLTYTRRRVFPSANVTYSPCRFASSFNKVC